MLVFNTYFTRCRKYFGFEILKKVQITIKKKISYDTSLFSLCFSIILIVYCTLYSCLPFKTKQIKINSLSTNNLLMFNVVNRVVRGKKQSNRGFIEI